MAKEFLRIDGIGEKLEIIISDDTLEFFDNCKNKRILAICMWGRTRNGKSTFLNAIISYLENPEEFLNLQTDIPDIFTSGQTDRRGGVTEGECNSSSLFSNSNILNFSGVMFYPKLFPLKYV